MCFVNFSNHASENWCPEQKKAAQAYGEILDIAFPQVPSLADAGEIADIAEKYTEQILREKPACVMCQGEFSLSYSVIRRLQEHGILCVCACSERKVSEAYGADGTCKKTSVFEFRQFRSYEMR